LDVLRVIRIRAIASIRVPVAVLVARTPADGLVAAGGEGPPSVRAGTVAGQQDTPHVGLLAGAVEGGVQFVDGPGAEGVANVRAVEGDPDRPRVDRAVVGDVLGVSGVDRRPAVSV